MSLAQLLRGADYRDMAAALDGLPRQARAGRSAMAEQLGAKAEVAVGSTRRPEPMREGRRKGVRVTMEDGESETARCSREPETETERSCSLQLFTLRAQARGTSDI
jgi:hypothetical protein